MTTTTTIICQPGQWTQVSAASSNVIVQGPTFAYRVAVGASAPAGIQTGLLVNEPDGVFSASGLASTDNVYVTPLGMLQMSVQVIAS